MTGLGQTAAGEQAPNGDAVEPEEFLASYTHLRTGKGIRRGGEQYQKIHIALAKAALIEIAQHGFNSYSMDDAAVRAGVSIRTAYRHYNTKTELAIEAIKQMPVFTGWADGEDSSEDRFRRSLSIGAAHRAYLIPIFATVLVNRQDYPELLATFTEQVLAPREAALAQWLADGRERGELRDDIPTEAIAAVITGVLAHIEAGLLTAESGEDRAELLFRLIWPIVKAN